MMGVQVTRVMDSVELLVDDDQLLYDLSSHHQQILDLVFTTGQPHHSGAEPFFVQFCAAARTAALGGK